MSTPEPEPAPDSAAEERINLQVSPPFREVVEAEALLSLAGHVLEREGQPQACLSLVIATDEVMVELNHRYTGRREPTDVLAFPAGSGNEVALVPLEESYLGDVIISYPQAARQAGDYANTIQEELELLTVHGILHLLGYDHGEEVARERMWQRQRELLREFRAQGE